MKYSRKDFLHASLLSSAGLLHGGTVFGSDSARRHSRPRSRAKDQNGCSISIFSKHLQWLEYGEMAKVAADIGFDGVDLTVRPGGHVLPERVERDLPEAVRAVRDEGLEVYMITTTIGDPDDEYAESILKTASQLGIGHYRTDWFPYDDSKSIPENLEQFRSKLHRLAAMNSEYDIQGDYQNHAGTSFGSSIWDLWIVLNELDTQWIGCQYDIRHATVEGANTWQNGLAAIHPHIGTLDIKDFQWAQAEDGWREQNVPLGEGMVNFEQYLKLLQKYQVQVPISLHYEYDLGGVERGAETVETDKKNILEAFRRDLKILDGWLSEAGLNRVTNF